MGRFKVQKQDTFIDMTPMSDVMVLLLTFFMLTATFTKDEPIKVVTPGSVSDIQIPEKNLLTIYVEPNGKVFMTMDSPTNMEKLINEMEVNGSLPGLTANEKKTFAQVSTFGTPLDAMQGWLDLKSNPERDAILKNAGNPGIPTDSLNNEFKTWVQAARKACGDGMGIAIKADKKTPYAIIKKVMDSLRELDENRYNLITSLKGGEDN